MDDYDPDSLSPDEANKQIIKSLHISSGTEDVAISDSLDRILMENITSSINVPSSTNSAMDGYALHARDLPESKTKELKLVGTSLAGQAYSGKVNEGECVRIMTGAVMPENTDTVVIQELVNVENDNVIIGVDTKPGSNVRQAGEDISIGDTVLAKGIRLSPADIGLIASLGQARVTVQKKLKVAFFSTGDELRSIGEELEEGMIYDSNRYTLRSMLSRLNVEIIDLGVIRDVREDIDHAFQSASEQADVILTSGGVSVGDADYVKESLESLGEMNFWKVAMKPGRPLAFGKINQAYFFGLPGNPVSVMVTFYQFVQPAIRHLMGEQDSNSFTFKVPCTSQLKKRPGRVEFQRGVLERNDNGELTVRKTGAQGSGILNSMSKANCFIILPLENEGIEVGAMVDVQPFYGLI